MPRPARWTRPASEWNTVSLLPEYNELKKLGREYYIKCDECNKLFRTDPECEGKIVGGCKWKCNKCMQQKSVISSNNYVAPAIGKTITPVTNKSNIVTKYRVVGSPDIHSVLYDTGNIIKSVEDHKTEDIIDIREMDSKGKFGYPVRGYSRQLR